MLTLDCSFIKEKCLQVQVLCRIRGQQMKTDLYKKAFVAFWLE